MFLCTSPYYTLNKKLIYIGSYIPPYIRQPPPLLEVAFASAILGGFVFSMRKEIKLLTDKAIHYIETKNFRNKPSQVFQNTFKYLKSNSITRLFFKTVFYIPLTELAYTFFIPPAAIGVLQIIEQNIDVNRIEIWNLAKSIFVISVLSNSILRMAISG